MVKEELCQIKSSKREELAELAALIQLGGELIISEGKPTIWFRSIHPIVARRFLSLAKNLYDIKESMLLKSDTPFKNKKQIEIGIDENVQTIMSEHDLFTSNLGQLEIITQGVESKRAYLRGAFLRNGSVNHPKTANYHLEISSDSSTQIVFIHQLMIYFDLNAKISKRRSGFIAYIKGAEHIVDFLRIIGLNQLVFEYEDYRIKRDFNNSINRVVNIEIANEKRVIKAANKQLEDILLVEQSIYYEELDEKIIRVMILRKENPDASLAELALEYEDIYNEKISKSGINHRLLKIKTLADEIRYED